MRDTKSKLDKIYLKAKGGGERGGGGGRVILHMADIYIYLYVSPSVLYVRNDREPVAPLQIETETETRVGPKSYLVV